MEGDMEQKRGIQKAATVKVPTNRGRHLILERDGDTVKVSYTGLKTLVVTLQDLWDGVKALGDGDG